MFKRLIVLCLMVAIGFEAIMMGLNSLPAWAAEEEVYSRYSLGVPGITVLSTDKRLQDEAVQLTGTYSSLSQDDPLLDGLDRHGILWDVQLVDGEGAILKDLENLSMRIDISIPKELKKLTRLFYVNTDGSKNEIEIELVEKIGYVPKNYFISPIGNIESLGKLLFVWPYSYGDVNGDHEITVQDALEVLRAAVKLRVFSEALIATADVDADSEATAQDALWILKHVVKRIDTFPVETTYFRVSEEKLVWTVEPQDGLKVIGKSYVDSGQIMEDDYYIAQKDGKYGLIDTAGTWIVEPKFATILSGKGGYFFSYNEADMTSESEGYTLNEKKELIAIKAKDVFIDSEKETSECYYDLDNECFIKANAESGIVEDFDYQFTELIGVRSCHLKPAFEGSSEKAFVVEVSEKYAVAAGGQLQTKFIFDEVGGTSEGCIPARYGHQWAYYDEDGGVVPGLHNAIRSNAANGQLNTQNPWEKVFPADFTEGYVVVFDGSHYALFNRLDHNNEILHFGLFEELTEVKNGKLWAKKDGKWGVLDLNATLEANN